MAGSLNHIVADNGDFAMNTIENIGDAHEALEECYNVIAYLCNGDRELLIEACRAVRAIVPESESYPPPRSELPKS